jgi:hypothetical protein
LTSDSLSYFGVTYQWSNNNDFIDQEFWDGDPTNNEIIDAIYGNGFDTVTAYTQNWSTYTSTSCNPSVIRTGTLPTTMTANRIYVIT